MPDLICSCIELNCLIFTTGPRLVDASKGSPVINVLTCSDAIFTIFSISSIGTTSLVGEEHDCPEFTKH